MVCQVVSGRAGPYRVVPGLIGSCRVVSGLAGSCLVMTGPFRVLPGPGWVVPGVVVVWLLGCDRWDTVVGMWMPGMWLLGCACWIVCRVVSGGIP